MWEKFGIAQSELLPLVRDNSAEFEPVGSDCWAVPAGKCYSNTVGSTAERSRKIEESILNVMMFLTSLLLHVG